MGSRQQPSDLAGVHSSFPAPWLARTGTPPSAYPGLQQAMLTELNLYSQVQPFGWSSFLIRFTAKSRAPVGSSCTSRLCSCARRKTQNRAVLASAPCGSASLRRLTAPPSAPSLATYETNVFYWPVKAQFSHWRHTPHVRDRATNVPRCG